MQYIKKNNSRKEKIVKMDKRSKSISKKQNKIESIIHSIEKND